MSTREIERLRIKFIAVAMLSIFLAMLFIGTTVNTVAFVLSKASVDRALTEMINGARRIEAGDHDYSMTFSQIFVPDYGRNAFFVLTYDEEGAVVGIYTNTPDGYGKELIEGYSSELLNSNLKRGEYQGYYYKRAQTEDGQTIVAFLEASIIISTQFRNISLTVLLCLLGMVITFFLVRRLSERAIRPEIENNLRQKQFITNASHELKTPLAVIRANTDMIELSLGESEWTQSTIKQVDRLNGLIQNLVMIARSREQEDRSELTEIDVSRIIEESVAPYELLAEQTARRIEREIEPDVRLRADESRLRQLSTILIDNAIKYCDEKGTICVSLHRQKSGKGIDLVVSNDYAAGEGIDCARFFDRFYRADASHNIDSGGYGIGLSIAESICKQYGGTIRAEWSGGVISFACTLR